MSIEKKSLISNRSASKKAIVAKPEVSQVAATRMSSFKAKPGSPRIQVGSPKIQVGHSKIQVGSPKIQVGSPKVMVK